MSDKSKDAKQLAFLFEWMRIARKPGQSLRQDIQLLFQLIGIPVTESQLRVIHKQIDPLGTKGQLSREDVLGCFAVEEESRKGREKELVKAFRYVSADQNDISFQDLRGHFRAEEIDAATTEMLIKQLCEYENEQGRFDYKRFAASIY